MAADLAALLADVTAAARGRDQAEQAYRTAVVRAYEELEHVGAPHPYVTLAAAAGVTRQATRELVQRARATAA